MCIYWYAKVVVCCLSSDGISLHIDDVEPANGKTADYGFAQLLKTFVVESPARTPTTGDLGTGNRSCYVEI